MIEFHPNEIRTYYQSRLKNPKQQGHELRAACPVHGGKDPNFNANLETGQCFCHSVCGRGFDMISLEMELSGQDFVACKATVFRMVGRPDPTYEERDIEGAYDYTDEHGRLLYQVVRKTGKKFMQRRPDGAGGWKWGLGDTRAVPFMLPQLIDAEIVAIGEGEKDCLNLSRLGIPATCNNGGAGNFKPELAKWFAGKKVVIFPDNDEPGRKHAMGVAAILDPVAQSVRIVEIPDLPEKGDVSDFISRGGTLEQLSELYKQAQDWTPEWQFSAEIPDENDKYVRTLSQFVEEIGGPNKFWDLTSKPGVTTPWLKLTKAIRGGMKNGEVYIIGANQGTGKTSLAIQFAVEALRKKLGVLLFSMEMGWHDVFQRMIAIEARVDLLEFQELQESRQASPVMSDMVSRLSCVQRELSNYPLFVSRKTGVTPEYLLHESDRLKKKNRIDLIIVDHMQLMSTTGKVRGDYEKFTAISRATKETAVQINVPVLLVSQTSRSNESDKRAELEVSDLRGSGALEEDAAAVMLVYPDGEDRKKAIASDRYTKGPVKTWLKLGKNRYGLQGMCMPLLHYKTCTRFDLYNSENGREVD